jgi:predicted enzyme related to lactoylglutathione lyase
MKKIYTCFVCGFPMAFEEEQVVPTCPGCGAPRSQFLEEPWAGSIDRRRIHVDPPEVDPNRDPLDISFHTPKDFAPRKGDGRVRRWVLGYRNGQAAEMRAFYEDLFGWDMVDTVDSDADNPTMYCATGPGTPKWEPRVCSMGFGFLKPEERLQTAPAASFILEVKSIDESLEKVIQFGGKVLKERYTEVGNEYAVVEDPEGNQFYLWELKDAVPEYCENPVTAVGAQ